MSEIKTKERKKKEKGEKKRKSKQKELKRATVFIFMNLINIFTPQSFEIKMYFWPMFILVNTTEELLLFPCQQSRL